MKFFNNKMDGNDFSKGTHLKIEMLKTAKVIKNQKSYPHDSMESLTYFAFYLNYHHCVFLGKGEDVFLETIRIFNEKTEDNDEVKTLKDYVNFKSKIFKNILDSDRFQSQLDFLYHNQNKFIVAENKGEGCCFDFYHDFIESHQVEDKIIYPIIVKHKKENSYSQKIENCWLGIDIYPEGGLRENQKPKRMTGNSPFANEINYHFFSNNCEHFSNFIMDNEWRSYQSEWYTFFFPIIPYYMEWESSTTKTNYLITILNIFSFLYFIIEIFFSIYKQEFFFLIKKVIKKLFF
jgi:hypothetical protein